MSPTIVNIAAPFCHVNHIIKMGGVKYASLGRPNNTGTRIVCVSGDVQRPGYFEIEVGAATMGQLIYDMAGGRPSPGGSHTARPAGGAARNGVAPARSCAEQKQTPAALASTRV